MILKYCTFYMYNITPLPTSTRNSTRFLHILFRVPQHREHPFNALDSRVAAGLKEHQNEQGRHVVMIFRLKWLLFWMDFDRITY